MRNPGYSCLTGSWIARPHSSGHSEKTSLCLCVPVNENGKMQLLGDAVLGWWGSRKFACESEIDQRVQVTEGEGPC